MALTIATNIESLEVRRNLAHSMEDIGKSYERLSSGQRINRAGDDAAGLSIAENLRAQIRSMAFNH